FSVTRYTSITVRRGLHTGLPRAAPPVPAPLVPRDAAEIGESRRGGDAEPRRAPDAVDHDEDGVGDVVLRDGDAAAAAAGDDARRAAAQRVQCRGGGGALLRPRGGERRRGEHDLRQPADLTPLKGTQFVAGGSPSSRRPTSATTARPCAPLSSSPSGWAVSQRAASSGR